MILQVGEFRHLALDTEDALETNAISLAIHFNLLLHGDAAAAASQLAVRPPGMNDFLPNWSLEGGRTVPRDLYRQAERVASGTWGPSLAENMLETELRRRGWIRDAWEPEKNGIFNTKSF